MNRIGKIIFASMLFLALITVSLHAETAAPESLSAAVSAPAHEAGGEALVPMAAPTVFSLFGLPISSSMICTWIVALFIIILVRVTTGRLTEIPGRGQNVMEALIEGWQNLASNVLEPKVVKWVFPYAMTFFIFIVIANLTDLFPFVGSVGYGLPDKECPLPLAVTHVGTPFLRPPTTDANLTVAMAGIFFFMGLYWAVRYNGFWGFIRHTFGVKVDSNKYAFIPLFLLFIFIGIMESFSILFIRPVALALRLYGNIFGGETMLTMAMSQKSFFMATLLALPGYFFEIVVCLLQAFVFAMLSVAFVGTMCTHADEEHGH